MESYYADMWENPMVITGAREGNLKGFSLELPRHKLIVFTGLSGSGKSTLAVDLLYTECQRQYLETIGMQGIAKPQVDSVQGASPAVIISQNKNNRNPRSTVGTLTDIYTDLRMVYEKLGVRSCPHCGAVIAAVDCREETEKREGEFYVYMYCHRCGQRMEKFTRSHFSYNTREGACPSCAGLGKVLSINLAGVINEELSIDEGAVALWDSAMRIYQSNSLKAALHYYGLGEVTDLPVKEYSELQKTLLLHGADCLALQEAFPRLKPPRTVSEGKFEGVVEILQRRTRDPQGIPSHLTPFFASLPCQACQGERLNSQSRQVTVAATRLPELAIIPLTELQLWAKQLQEQLDVPSKPHVELYLTSLMAKIQRLVAVGLSYLTLDRQGITLSGGEAQRVKLAALLSSEMTGLIYILDEPTQGLHPRDTAGMVTVLEQLRDRDNTVIVIEHDTEVMQRADYIVDLGPGAGKLGGEIVGLGSLAELKQQPGSPTGLYLQRGQPPWRTPRSHQQGELQILGANLHNLQQLDVTIPLGVMTAVVGVSGSGKSTLIFEVLAANSPDNSYGQVVGLEQFGKIITIEQTGVTRMKRSNVATFSGIYTDIRHIFSSLSAAREQALVAKHFSFNSKGGRCENCEGLGVVTSNMMFFADIEVVCPVCGGKQFSPEVLAVKYEGHSIKDVLLLSVDEAGELFAAHRKIQRVLALLKRVGLGYLELGQTLTTLSGGEGQRLKLAVELLTASGKHNLYLLDEPTTGLHPWDTEHFLTLLQSLVEEGNTVVVVEHNTQVIRNCDWVIELGPGGGSAGGKIIYQGVPEAMVTSQSSVTGKYI